MSKYDGVGPWHCTECGHDHQGARLAYICIGCPCGFVPDDKPSSMHLAPEPEDFIYQPDSPYPKVTTESGES